MAIKNKTAIFFIQRTSSDSIARERRERKGLFCAYSTGSLASSLTIGV
nr:MAG TPA: hypothetical protein [Caudoviricetes sp.]